MSSDKRLEDAVKKAIASCYETASDGNTSLAETHSKSFMDLLHLSEMPQGKLMSDLGGKYLLLLCTVDPEDDKKRHVYVSSGKSNIKHVTLLQTNSGTSAVGCEVVDLEWLWWKTLRGIGRTLRGKMKSHSRSRIAEGTKTMKDEQDLADAMIEDETS